MRIGGKGKPVNSEEGRREVKNAWRNGQAVAHLLVRYDNAKSERYRLSSSPDAAPDLESEVNLDPGLERSAACNC